MTDSTDLVQVMAFPSISSEHSSRCKKILSQDLTPKRRNMFVEFVRRCNISRDGERSIKGTSVLTSGQATAPGGGS